jgi:hypothetical protein
MRQVGWNAVLIGIAVLPAATMLLIERANSSSGADDIDTAPAIVGSVIVHITPTPPGGVVFASVTVSADRPVHVDGLRVDVHDASGRGQDAAGRTFSLPASGPIDLEVDAHTVTEARQIHQGGVFTYNLAYRQNNNWTTLPPYETFTIK